MPRTVYNLVPDYAKLNRGEFYAVLPVPKGVGDMYSIVRDRKVTWEDFKCIVIRVMDDVLERPSDALDGKVTLKLDEIPNSKNWSFGTFQVINTMTSDMGRILYHCAGLHGLFYVGLNDRVSCDFFCQSILDRATGLDLLLCYTAF